MTTTTLPVRRGDPLTSHAAAAQAVRGRPRVREQVLAALRDHGPMTHDQIMTHVNASPSGVRTRVSELVRDGEVEAVPGQLGRSDMGNRALIWRATNV